jgi:hypothetical protein
MRRIRPTYANVIATLALFVALGGGAYAATNGPEPIKEVVRRSSRVVSIPASHSGEAVAWCRKGERALGGGGIDLTGFHENFTLISSLPRVAGEPRSGEVEGEPSGWEVRYFNRAERGGAGDDSAIEVGAYVVCGK